MKRQALLVVPAAVVAVCAPALTGTAAAGPPTQLEGRVTVESLVVTGARFPGGRAAHFEFADQTVASSSDGYLTTRTRTRYQCVIVEGKSAFNCTGRGQGEATVHGVGAGETEFRSSLKCVSISATEALCESRFTLRGISGPIDGLLLVGQSEPVAPGVADYTARLHFH